MGRMRRDNNSPLPIARTAINVKRKQHSQVTSAAGTKMRKRHKELDHTSLRETVQFRRVIWPTIRRSDSMTRALLNADESYEYEVRTLGESSAKHEGFRGNNFCPAYEPMVSLGFMYVLLRRILSL